MKEIRFRRPEFQGKLRRARRFERRHEDQPSRLHQIWPWAGLIFLAVAAYFLFFSKIFVIAVSNHDQVNGALSRISRERKYLIPKSHFAILTRSNLLPEIQSDNPETRRITKFKKILPNRLEVEIEMREQRYIWQSGTNYFSVDQDGTFFNSLPPASLRSGGAGRPGEGGGEVESFGGAKLIIDRSVAPIAVGTKISDSRLIPFLDQLQELWPRQVHDVGFAGFSLPAIGSPDIFVKTKTGFQVYFDLGRSAQAQLANLNLVLSREINPATYTGLSYIDLRLPRQAYYCYLDAPCAPENATSTNNIIKSP